MAPTPSLPMNWKDGWEKNRRVSRSIGNSLGPDGIRTAQELGKDFQVAVRSLEDAGYQFWSYSKENPVPVFGSESENTEQTARYFLSGPGYTNMNFQAIWGLNSQQYGSLTHRFKKDIFGEMAKIYGADWKGSAKEKAAKAKAMLKNRFFQYPEGETLIEADWRIGWSFIDLLRAQAFVPGGPHRGLDNLGDLLPAGVVERDLDNGPITGRGGLDRLAQSRADGGVELVDAADGVQAQVVVDKGVEIEVDVLLEKAHQGQDLRFLKRKVLAVSVYRGTR